MFTHKLLVDVADVSVQRSQPFNVSQPRTSKSWLAYLFSSLITALSAGPSTPFGGCTDTEVALGGLSPAGVAEPSLEAFAAASAFAFLFFADFDSLAAPAAGVEDAIMLGRSGESDL